MKKVVIILSILSFFVEKDTLQKVTINGYEIVFPYTPVTEEEITMIAPVIKKWTDFYNIDFAQARVVKVDTGCFNCPDDPRNFFTKDDKDDTDKRIGVDYSPNKQRYVTLFTLDYRNGKYYAEWDDSQNVWLFDRKQKHANMILELGACALAEAVFWVSNDIFIVVGYHRYDAPIFKHFVKVYNIVNQTQSYYEIISEIKEDTDFSGYMQEVYYKEKGISVIN